MTLSILIWTAYLKAMLLGTSCTPPPSLSSGAVEYDVATLIRADIHTKESTKENKYKLYFNSMFMKGEQADQNPSNFFILNRENNEKRTFCDFFGYHYEFSDPPKSELPIKIIPQTETRIIQGHLCLRYMVVYEKGNYEAWIATDINVNYPNYFPGCALEFTLPVKYGLRVYKAININNFEVVDGFFNIEGYTKITREEFKNKFIVSR